VGLVLTNFAKASPGAITNATLVINDDEALNVPQAASIPCLAPNPGPDGFVERRGRPN